MRIAQGLYEDGAITYMRTDGVQMDGSAISAARKAIADRYDASYVPDKPRHVPDQGQERAGSARGDPPDRFRARTAPVSGDHARLYELIWKRALASQMASARMERTTIDSADGTGQHGLRATGQVVLFPGYLALYEEGDATTADATRMPSRLPRLREGDAPAKKAVTAEQHFTQPPPRFSEASLVKRMEELGIGRPSTYASTIKTLKDRAYVRDREEPLLRRGERAAGDGVPRTLLREICRLRFHRRSRGRARRGVGRPRAVAGGARQLLEATSSRAPPR